eukprot:4472219-Heterocapsa_arctica.AAC.1
MIGSMSTGSASAPLLAIVSGALAKVDVPAFSSFNFFLSGPVILSKSSDGLVDALVLGVGGAASMPSFWAAPSSG